MVEGVTGQILQLRAEMGSEFSTLRREARATEKRLLHEMGKMYAHTMKEIIERVDGVSSQISSQINSFRQEVLSGLAEIKDRLP
jgi:hypothetical protein